MEHHGAHRMPLWVLYTLLGLLFVWSGAYIIPMTLEVVPYVVRPAMKVATPFIADWPDGEIKGLGRGLDAHATPPLKRGDRLVSLNGEPFTTSWQVAQRVNQAGPQGRLDAVVKRGEGDKEETFASTINLCSFAEIEGSIALRGLSVFLGIVLPWVCFLVGFWVAAVRPRDPMAWLVLATLLGFAVAAWTQPSFLRWGDWLRIPGSLYAATFGATWPLFFSLFGIHFGGELDWVRRRRWLEWILLGPVAVSATGILVAATIETLDLRVLIPVYRPIVAAQQFAVLFGMAAVSFFFLNVGWKSGLATQADVRRRFRLILGGATLSLSPLLVLVLTHFILSRPLESFPVYAILVCLGFLPFFPLTLAYVILVDRAMDVRVAVRQGLRYAATRGVIKAVVALVVIGVAWNIWKLASDPTANRPRKLQAIAWGVTVAIVVPRFTRRAFDWTDRRFFRESYDVERVLTDLSEQVRTIHETGPLLDTVLDRIGGTLHVERLAAFVQEGNRFVPFRSRGFDPPPSVEFEVRDDAIVRLHASGRPLRIRHDDPESPLRREMISEENRAKLSQVNAELLLPLNGKSDLVGVITLGPKKSEEPYSLTDAKLLGSVASQTGLALENSRLMATIVSEVAKREGIRREIDIARGVQQRLFPQRVPRVAGVDCAGSCRPAQGIGGDYYDFLELPEGRLGIALGDVAGKGIPAALLMASLQASLRGQRLSGPADLAQLMANLNFLIHEASPENRYATFFYGELDPASGRLDYVNAGHNAPMLFRAGGSNVERLKATGPVVGLVEAGKFEQRSVEVHAGDLLLVYSDGISEAMNPKDEEWGEERLASAVVEAGSVGALGLIERLFVAADAFAAGATQHDDMTVVAVRMTA